MPMVKMDGKTKKFPYTKAGKAKAMKAKKMMMNKKGAMPTPNRMKPKMKPKMKKGY